MELLRFCDPWSTRSPVGGKGGQESFRETRGPLSPGHGGESRLRSLGPTSQAPHTELLETQRGGQSVSRTRGRRLGSAAASRSRGKRPGCSVSGALTENLAPVSVCRYPNIPPPMMDVFLGNVRANTWNSRCLHKNLYLCRISLEGNDVLHLFLLSLLCSLYKELTGLSENVLPPNGVRSPISQNPLKITLHGPRRTKAIVRPDTLRLPSLLLTPCENLPAPAVRVAGSRAGAGAVQPPGARPAGAMETRLPS